MLLLPSMLVPYKCSPCHVFRKCNLYMKQNLSYFLSPAYSKNNLKLFRHSYGLVLSILKAKFHLINGKQSEACLDFNKHFTHEEKNKLLKNMLIFEDFISSDEEASLFEEVEPYMKRLKYELDHWDDAIHGFRETERLRWNVENSKILDRVYIFAFPPDIAQLEHVHVLDLLPEGHIKPHIDSTRFCGNVIAGLSLLSDSVMRLVHDEQKTKIVDVLLRRRSLYIMKDTARYEYTHEILPNNMSKHKNIEVPRTRRISVICRNEPKKDD